MAKEAVSTHILGYLLYLPELHLPRFSRVSTTQRVSVWVLLCCIYPDFNGKYPKVVEFDHFKILHLSSFQMASIPSYD